METNSSREDRKIIKHRLNLKKITWLKKLVVENQDFPDNQDLPEKTIPKEKMKTKQENLVGAIEVEVEWTIKEKATKVVSLMAEVVIHVVTTQTKLQIVILTVSTQDNQEEVVTTVAKIQDQIIKVIKLKLEQFQIKGMAKV